MNLWKAIFARLRTPHRPAPLPTASPGKPPLIYAGPNADAVNEVIDFAFSDQVFSSRGRGGYHDDGHHDHLLIVSDMRRAVDAAGGVGPESLIPVDYAAADRIMHYHGVPHENFVYTWYDLQQSMTAACIWTTGYYEWRKQNEIALRPIHSMAIQWTADSPWPLYEHLLRLLPRGPLGPRWQRGYYRRYIAHQAAHDLEKVAESRAFNGVVDNYWESLYRIYRRGLWPCGWHGTWPAPGYLMTWHRRPGWG